MVQPHRELIRDYRYDAEANRVVVTVDGLAFNVRTLFRLVDGRWFPVRGAEWSSAMVLFDYEAPLGITSKYKLMTYRELDGIWYSAATHSNEVGVTPKLTEALLKAS